METRNEIQHKMLVDKVVRTKLLSTFYSLKMLMLVLLSITIGSCYSIESDCIDPAPLPEDYFWEPIPNSPTDVCRMAFDVNGNSLGYY